MRPSRIRGRMFSIWCGVLDLTGKSYVWTSVKQNLMAGDV